LLANGRGRLPKSIWKRNDLIDKIEIDITESDKRPELFVMV